MRLGIIYKTSQNDEVIFKTNSPILIEDLKENPIKIKVVKHTLKGFREKTSKPYMMLTCFEGCFKLKGEPEDLQMLYQIGIG